jgi:hypothetical protein
MSLAIEAFVENARGFCSWVESEKHDFTTVRQLLSALMQGVPYLVTQAGSGKEWEYPQRGNREHWISGNDWIVYWRPSHQRQSASMSGYHLGVSVFIVWLPWLV